MNGSSAVDVEYVQRDIFDEKLRNIDDRATYDRERTDDKFEKFQAVMEKGMAEIRGELILLNAKVDHNNETLNVKIDKVDDTLSTAVMGLIDRFDDMKGRFDDMKDYQNKWFTVLGVSLSILTVAFTVLAFFK